MSGCFVFSVFLCFNDIMMRDAIQNFAAQFTFQPKLENAHRLPKYRQYILLGMGGSHLAADLALVTRPDLPLVIHSDYGLPALPAKELKSSLVIASSYSGNTEEALDGFDEARKKRLPAVAIAVSGELITQAKKYRAPYILLPDTGIQPRSALGFSIMALMKVMNEEQELKRLHRLAKTLKPATLEAAGQALAERLKHSIPVIYSSRRNQSLAYNWKIKFNETGKVPAFYNVLPELNHNEMTGFDVRPASRPLSEHFYFLFLRDTADHPRVQKRMRIIDGLYRDRGLRVEVIPLAGKNVYEKIFRSLLLADWAAVHTAALNELESEQVPMVEEFKRLMK